MKKESTLSYLKRSGTAYEGYTFKKLVELISPDRYEALSAVEKAGGQVEPKDWAEAFRSSLGMKSVPGTGPLGQIQKSSGKVIRAARGMGTVGTMAALGSAGGGMAGAPGAIIGALAGLLGGAGAGSAAANFLDPEGTAKENIAQDIPLGMIPLGWGELAARGISKLGAETLAQSIPRISGPSGIVPFLKLGGPNVKPALKMGTPEAKAFINDMTSRAEALFKAGLPVSQAERAWINYVNPGMASELSGLSEYYNPYIPSNRYSVPAGEPLPQMPQPTLYRDMTGSGAFSLRNATDLSPRMGVSGLLEEPRAWPISPQGQYVPVSNQSPPIFDPSLWQNAMERAIVQNKWAPTPGTAAAPADALEQFRMAYPEAYPPVSGPIGGEPLPGPLEAPVLGTPLSRATGASGGRLSESTDLTEFGDVVPTVEQWVQKVVLTPEKSLNVPIPKMSKQRIAFLKKQGFSQALIDQIAKLAKD